jgi:PemK-like, MazF-like toxin of type II toxin-antitoxin system
VTAVRLVGRLVGQCLAAGYLTLPAVLWWFLRNEPERLRDFLWINAALAPLAALWVVLEHRRVRLRIWWVLARTAGLLVASTAVTWLAMDLTGVGVRELDPLRIAAVLALVWAWILGWRLVDGAPEVRGPQRGEIWSAMVPFEKGSYEKGEQRAKDRPCVVVSTSARHAYVLKITSVDQRNRPGYLRLASGWHPRSEKESWIKLEPLLKVPLPDFREHLRNSPPAVWRTLEKRYPANAKAA